MESGKNHDERIAWRRCLVPTAGGSDVAGCDCARSDRRAPPSRLLSAEGAGPPAARSDEELMTPGPAVWMSRLVGSHSPRRAARRCSTSRISATGDPRPGLVGPRRRLDIALGLCTIRAVFSTSRRPGSIRRTRANLWTHSARCATPPRRDDPPYHALPRGGDALSDGSYHPTPARSRERHAGRAKRRISGDLVTFEVTCSLVAAKLLAQPR